MNALERVRNEIIDLHDFFTEWFNGTVDRNQLEPRFLSRLDKNVAFIPPEGRVVGGDGLKVLFEKGYGSNSEFRIQIRDVKIRHRIGDTVLATYTEWQTGAVHSAKANNARVTSVLMEIGPPVRWLHIHETLLPEAIRAADPFDF